MDPETIRGLTQELYVICITMIVIVLVIYNLLSICIIILCISSTTWLPCQLFFNELTYQLNYLLTYLLTYCRTRDYDLNAWSARRHFIRLISLLYC